MTNKIFDGGVGYSVGSTGRSGEARKVYPTDRAWEIVDVVPNKGPNDGYVIAKTNNGNIAWVKIKQESFERNTESIKKKTVSSDEVKFMGWLIDENMKKSLKDKKKQGKSMAVFQNTVLLKTKTIDGEKISIYECDYIVNIMNSMAHKFKYGPVTIEKRHNPENNSSSVSNVLFWERKTVLVSDKSKIDEVFEIIEKGNKDREENQYRYVPHGFQFFTIVKNKNYDETVKGSTPYLVVNFSTPFSYIRKTEEQDGFYVNREFYDNLVEKYEEYIKEDEDIKAKYGEDAEVALAYFEYLPASKLSKSLRFFDTQTGSPLYQMSHGLTGLALNTNRYLEGVNYGGICYVQLSSDKAVPIMDEEGNTTVEFEYKNFVNQLFANTYKAHIFSFLYAPYPLKDGEEEHIANAMSVVPELAYIKRTSNHDDENIANKVSDEEVEEQEQHHSKEEPVYHSEEDKIDSTKIEAKKVDVENIDDDIPF